VRVNAANLNSLKTKRDAITRFMHAYAKSTDWAYSSDEALQAYAKFADTPIDTVRYMVKNFQSKDQDQLLEFKGMDRVLEEALAAKRIAKAMTQAELKDMFDIVYKPGS
jgi:NitT/TauT family transport system substrate-binding protein